jgi:hypothetical protein
MREKTLIVLAVITIPLALAAVFVPGPTTRVERQAENGSMLPSLKAGIENASTLSVTGPDGMVTLVRKPAPGKIDHGWTLSGKSGYPVDPAKIKPVLDALITLRGVEPKTARPSLYSQLDLGEPGSGSQAHLVTISDVNNKPLAAIVIGKQKFGAAGENDGGIYVRKPGDAQAWLARPTVTLPPDALSWIDQTVLNIDANTIKELVITPARGAPLDLVRGKAGEKFAVKNLPKNAKLKSEAPGLDIAGSFNLQLDDVKPAAQVSGAPVANARAVTFDGMAADLTLVKQGDKSWVTVAASGTGDAAKSAGAITVRTKGWAYAIPDATATTLESKLSDLEQAPSSKPDGSGAKPAAGKKETAAGLARPAL